MMTVGTDSTSKSDCERTLEPAWERIGEPAQYPCETETAFQIARCFGRDIDRKRLEYLQATDQFNPPPKFAGRLLWDAKSIVRLIGVCDLKRFWVPGSPVWMENATASERAKELMKRSGGFQKIKDQSKDWSIRDLALMMLAADREQAEKLFSMIEIRLEVEGIE